MGRWRYYRAGRLVKAAAQIFFGGQPFKSASKGL